MAKSSKSNPPKPADEVKAETGASVVDTETGEDSQPEGTIDEVATDTVDAATAEADTVEGTASTDAVPEADGDDTLADTSEAKTDDGDDTPSDDLTDAGEDLSSHQSDDTLADNQSVDVSEPVQDPAPVAAPVQEKVVERKGGFVPMVLGGVVAAALGYGAAYMGLGNDTAQADMQAAIDAQGEQIGALTGRVDETQSAVESIDLSTLQGAIDGVEGQFGDLDQVLAAIGGRIDALDSRLTELEKQPMSQALSPEAVAAYEREMQALREAVAAQKAEVESLASDAIAAQQDANAQAQLAESRSALADLTARLQAGDGYAEPLSVLTGNGVDVPAAIVQAADGVPTLAALVADFPDAARDALRAARAVETPEQGGGLGSFLQNQLGARSVVPREGDDADAVLSRAEAAVRDGNLTTALEEIAKLPAEAQAELSDWTARATLRRDALAGAAALAQDLNQQ